MKGTVELTVAVLWCAVGLVFVLPASSWALIFFWFVLGFGLWFLLPSIVVIVRHVLSR